MRVKENLMDRGLSEVENVLVSWTRNSSAGTEEVPYVTHFDYITSRPLFHAKGRGDSRGELNLIPHHLLTAPSPGARALRKVTSMEARTGGPLWAKAQVG